MLGGKRSVSIRWDLILGATGCLSAGAQRPCVFRCRTGRQAARGTLLLPVGPCCGHVKFLHLRDTTLTRDGEGRPAVRGEPGARRVLGGCRAVNTTEFSSDVAFAIVQNK
jgi:hypothetical protein